MDLAHWEDPEGSGGDGGWWGEWGWGTHVNPWLIHVDVWQKLQYCKVISLQLIKINEKNKMKEKRESACKISSPYSGMNYWYIVSQYNNLNFMWGNQSNFLLKCDMWFSVGNLPKLKFNISFLNSQQCYICLKFE